MAKGRLSDVDAWLKRETPRVRRALENASRYFSGTDRLTVNTLEAIYSRESSFGTLLGTRGSPGPAGHFQFDSATAERYKLNVSKHNDQRFDMDYAASAAARYLKDLNTMFGKKTRLSEGRDTIAIPDVSERTKFVLGAFNAGEGRIASAQRLAEQSGKHPRLWADVQQFLEAAGSKGSSPEETRHYVEEVPALEAEFAQRSPADKSVKRENPRTGQYDCTDGHWVTIDDRPVFICA